MRTDGEMEALRAEYNRLMRRWWGRGEWREAALARERIRELAAELGVEVVWVRVDLRTLAVVEEAV
jgi:hypothetical protein